MNRKNYLLNLMTGLVVVLIVLLAGYILLDDIEGFRNRRETLNENGNSPEDEEDQAFVGTMDETYYMVVFKKDTYYWEGVKKGFDLAGAQLGVRTVFEGSEEYDTNAQLVFEKVVAKSPRALRYIYLC